MIWLFAPAVIILLIAAQSAPQKPEIWGGMALVLATLAMFYCLTVSIDKRILRFRFGIGIIGKIIKIDECESVTQVRNPWYYGWGIHYVSRGWIFNISGFDGIELKLKNGKIIILGTDEPEELLRAIRANMAME